MLKTSFERDLNKSFLVLEKEEEDFLWNYQAEMLLLNEIEGLLPCRAVAVDRKIQFHYDITSRQPFKRIFEGRSVGFEDIKLLLIQMKKAMEQLKRYLLSENQLCVKPDYIYGDIENGNYQFCFYPMYTENVREDIQQLAEFILNHLNYKDERGVRAGYEFYQQIQKENNSFWNIAEKICFFEEKEEETDLNQVSAEEKEPIQHLEEKEEEKESIWNRLFHFLYPKRKEEEKELIFELKDSSSYTREDILSACTVLEEKNYGCTRLLQQENGLEPEKQASFQLVSLEPEHYKTFQMNQFPFIVGKLETLVDGQISHSSVSRLHAKIIREEDAFYLEDLNSTNGTFVNERKLNTNEKTRIMQGDKIRFADISYQFF